MKDYVEATQKFDYDVIAESLVAIRTIMAPVFFLLISQVILIPTHIFCCRDNRRKMRRMSCFQMLFAIGVLISVIIIRVLSILQLGE